MKKSNIIKGTLILTAAGLITRIIGFLYRIFLSNALGPEQLGVYQLIFPVYGICHTLYASGIQTAISKLVAENHLQQKNTFARKILLCGTLLSFSLAIAVSILLFFSADTIAVTFLKEASCAPSLRILCFVFPFCGITSCINGYCYGRNKSLLPAGTQVLEQVVRVGTVFLVSILSAFHTVSCELAIVGVLTGELAACTMSLLSLFIPTKETLEKKRSTGQKLSANTLRAPLPKLVRLATPLTLNRLLLSLLHSYEAIMIPFLLRKNGLSHSESLIRYGVLNGMALPFIYFASSITNALAVLLLPVISEQDSVHNEKRIAATTERAISATLMLGIFCNLLFFFFGEALGNTVFHEASVGSYIRILSCLCPFLYLTTTLSSILNGLGKTMTTFATSLTGSLLRILLLCTLVPRYGMIGCFLALLFSQLVLCALELILVYYHTSFPFHAYRTIILPVFTASLGGFLCHRAYCLLVTYLGGDSLIGVLLACTVFTLLFLLVVISILKQGPAKAKGATEP